MRAYLAWLLWIFLPALSSAHKPSDSYLSFRVNGDSIEGQWDIALRDLEHAIGLDQNDDSLITWGELRGRYEAVSAFALSHLEVLADGVPCTNRLKKQLADFHSDGAYAVLQFELHCEPGSARVLELRYSFLFDLDPQHRGLLRIETLGHTQTAVLSPESPHFRAELANPARLKSFLQYAREGLWHIWGGYDHLLFLITLLLPAGFVFRAARWEPAAEMKPMVGEILKIVTSFSLAHSLTLSVAALGLLTLPSQVVESVIAASVLAAALNNVYPLVRSRLWTLAFGFGLIHGLAFASALLDFGLTGGSLALALAGFNLGVEAGQVAIVALVLPAVFAARRSPFYPSVVLKLGSLAIAGIAAAWLLERSLELARTMHG